MDCRQAGSYFPLKSPTSHGELGNELKPLYLSRGFRLRLIQLEGGNVEVGEK